MDTTASKSFFCVMLFLSALVAVSIGQGGPRMFMDPIVVERLARPGDVIKYTINMENQDEFNSLTLDVRIADITENVDGSYELVPAGTTTYSASRWLITSTSRLVVPPGSLRQVEVTLNVPRGVSGGLYAAIVFVPVTSEPAGDEDALGVTEFVFQMASFLEVVIQGTAIREEAYAASFDVGQAKDYGFLRGQVHDEALVFSASIFNQGNVHIVASGTLQIKTADGRTVARFPLGGGRGVILPGVTVALRTIVTRRLPPGEYIARSVVEYSRQRRPIVSEVSFVVEEAAVRTAAVEPADLARFFVDPPQVELSGRPGAFRSAVVELANRGVETIEIVSLVLPLVYDIFGDILPEEDRGEGPSWIELNPATFVLEPGRSRRIRLSAWLPQNEEGAYYADVVFRSSGDGAMVESGISLIILSGDDFVRRASLELLSIEDIGGALNVDYILKNEGNIHVNSSYEVALSKLIEQVILDTGQIIPAKSEQIARMSIPPDSFPVLPGAERMLSIMVPAELEQGDYELLLRMDYGSDEPLVVRTKLKIGGGQVDD